MKILRAAAFLGACLFTVGAFAQYPSGQTNPGQSGSAPATAPSTTSTQSTSGTGMGQSSTSAGQQSATQAPSTSQTPSTSPSTSPSTGAQPQTGNDHAQGAGMPSIDEQVSMLSGQLNLTPDQQGKAKTILQDQHTQAMTIVNDSTLSRDDKMQKIHSIRTSTISKMRDMLNDDQKTKFDTMVQQQNDRMRQMQQQGGSTPSSNTSAPPK